MMLASLLAVSAAVNIAAAFSLWSQRKSRFAKWPKFVPIPDVKRYNVLMRYADDTRTLYRGYDGLKARNAYLDAGMQAGVTVEFWEWDQKRGSKSA